MRYIYRYIWENIAYIIYIYIYCFIAKESARGELQAIKGLLETSVPRFEDEQEYWSYGYKKNLLFNEIGCKGWNAIHAAIVKEQKDVVGFFIKKYKISIY